MQTRIKKQLALAAAAFAVSTTYAHAAGPKLCISTWDLTNSYWVNLVNGAKEQAAKNGSELVVSNPSNDTGKQVDSIENFTTIGCKAIIIAAINPQATKSALTEARAKGVKIIAQSIETPVADVWASADEKDMGETIGAEAGKWIKDKLNGNAEVLVLDNDRIPQMITRKQGIEDGIKKYAPNAKIVAEQPAPGTSEAMQVTENVLQAHPKLQVVVSINDASALGALAAVESADRSSPTFFIGGIDATPEARTKIAAGSALRASVDNRPFENGKQDVDIALKLIKGEKLPYRQVVAVKAFTKAQ
ncbi:sugar ABC transporter substrate-binding protein [Paraburkholderia acidisoli]|uniref:Substrate-binding domain-containing protein n=1 Tax=Paraburkholderia acidisoli TaxID=2571748 RepID=A0A7Z2JGZ5_9BURK|nr:sugar ABC transporter substrate-binding protein [Paraburkholderia acidisoli]QGZ64281.1 substrate-binding domain-containing protein [Paraburkholderia acidisoli]